MQTKYVFVTGGVVSGLGKGITVASLGRLLKARGYKVITQKFDPYINIDPSNLDPYEHGEVFVTDDGAETDLDLGHYERFTEENLSENNSITMGKIFWNVLNKERQNGYNGKTIQVIPHITDEIKNQIRRSGNGNVVLTEVGGTVGDIESLPILEAIRQIAHDEGRNNVAFVHISLVPYLDYIGEMKTKPTQHSVRELLSRGIQPDIIVCRSDRAIPADLREKLALFCNVEPSCVIQNNHADCIYEVPLLLEEEHFADTLCEKLNLEPRQPDLAEWRALVDRYKNPSKQVTIALIGSYTGLRDSYLSVAEALNHAGAHSGVKVDIKWISAADTYDNCDGIVLAGAVGEECAAWKIRAAEYAKEKKIPFFGIGNGMQCALEPGVAGASSADASSIGVSVVSGGVTSASVDTKYRGAAKFKLPKGSISHKAYGTDTAEERFRGRFKVATQPGWILSEGSEIAELKNHPYFVCVQFHPEYKSRLTTASPLFESFIKAVVSL